MGHAHAEGVSTSDSISQARRMIDLANELEHEEDAMLDEHDCPEHSHRQAWCDLQQRRCTNLRQEVELISQLLFAEECPGVDRICFCADRDVPDANPMSVSEESE